MEGKKIKDVSELKQTKDGVVIEIKEDVDPQKIEQIVENCKAGKCECMSAEMKAKVSFMDFKNENGKLSIELKGDISKEDIETSMEKSKVIIK
jgi:cytochrome c